MPNEALQLTVALWCAGVVRPHYFFLADGEAAMQEVFHVHLHVFPRFRGDGFGLKFSPEYYTRRPTRAELDELAAKLASGMATHARPSDLSLRPSNDR